MDLFQALILGVVQGLTEFLPVSSTGHLILARDILGINVPSGLAVDAVLQLATILAVGVYFARDLWRLFLTGAKWIMRRAVSDEDRTLLLAVIYGTIPAIIIGLLLESYMETVFRSAGLVALMLVVGSFLFLFAERIATQAGALTPGKGFLIGLFQCLALIPGMSRSGSTIAGGLILGLTREAAARFSFILSFPIIVGSGAKKFLELSNEHLLGAMGVPLLMGSFVAFLVGLAAIHFLIRYLRTHSLAVFTYYRFALAAAVIAFLFFR
ncbi:undecaprenyl-diphosphatase UppP [Candidatus Parcubacteria bacterium]|nr:undecaprenyl-diphosphatase UppP [Candidatus Parcubacteria bacterium]